LGWEEKKDHIKLVAEMEEEGGSAVGR